MVAQNWPLYCTCACSPGAQVVITGRKIEKLEKVSQEIIEDGGLVHFIVCDNREEEQVKNMIAEVIEKFGQTRWFGE